MGTCCGQSSRGRCATPACQTSSVLVPACQASSRWFLALRDCRSSCSRSWRSSYSCSCSWLQLQLAQLRRSLDLLRLLTLLLPPLQRLMGLQQARQRTAEMAALQRWLGPLLLQRLLGPPPLQRLLEPLLQQSPLLQRLRGLQQARQRGSAGLQLAQLPRCLDLLLRPPQTLLLLPPLQRLVGPPPPPLGRLLQQSLQLQQ